MCAARATLLYHCTNLSGAVQPDRNQYRTRLQSDSKHYNTPKGLFLSEHQNRLLVLESRARSAKLPSQRHLAPEKSFYSEQNSTIWINEYLKIFFGILCVPSHLCKIEIKLHFKEPNFSLTFFLQEGLLQFCFFLNLVQNRLIIEDIYPRVHSAHKQTLVVSAVRACESWHGGPGNCQLRRDLPISFVILFLAS